MRLTRRDFIKGAASAAPTQNQYITVIGIPEPDGLLVVQSSDWTAL